MSGLRPAPTTFERGQGFELRVNGHVRTAEVRSALLDELLPVPIDTLPLEKLLEFRRRHGDLLPRFRAYLEDQVDLVLGISDPVLRQRQIDRIADDAEERSREAGAYLEELGARRIAKSSLLRILKLVPGLSSVIDLVQDLAQRRIRHGDFEKEPLAYLAFARAELNPVETYALDPMTGRPLAQAMQLTTGEPEWDY